MTTRPLPDTGQLRATYIPPVQVTATCETCGHKTTFTYIGDQTWPQAVAEKLGLPTVVKLWRCEHCQTTVTDLKPDPRR